MVGKLIANIYVLGRYTRRATKSKRMVTFAGYVSSNLYPPSSNTASRNTCLLEAHIATRILVIRKRI